MGATLNTHGVVNKNIWWMGNRYAAQTTLLYFIYKEVAPTVHLFAPKLVGEPADLNPASIIVRPTQGFRLRLQTQDSIHYHPCNFIIIISHQLNMLSFYNLVKRIRVIA